MLLTLITLQCVINPDNLSTMCDINPNNLSTMCDINPYNFSTKCDINPYNFSTMHNHSYFNQEKRSRGELQMLWNNLRTTARTNSLTMLLPKHCERICGTSFHPQLVSLFPINWHYSLYLSYMPATVSYLLSF